jgi:hypothetical protein
VRVLEEAEGMAGGIEHHPHPLLRLVFGDGSAQFSREGNTIIKALDGYVEVNHHLLFARCGRPHRRGIAGLVLERQTRAT